jgi:hypothetical protein
MLSLGREKHKNPRPKRDGGATCTHRGATLVGASIRRPHSARTCSLRADTPLLLTVEIPLAPTWRPSRDESPFGPRLLDPFRARFALGFHRFPARLATRGGAYSFRSSPFRYSTGRHSNNRAIECQAASRRSSVDTFDRQLSRRSSQSVVGIFRDMSCDGVDFPAPSVDFLLVKVFVVSELAVSPILP